MRKIPHALIVAGAVVLVLLIFGNRAGLSYFPDLRDARRFLASVFFVDSITTEGLKNDYALAGRGEKKVKVLIVPGHDNDSWGTEFRGVREADMTAELGEKLVGFLAKDKEFNVTLLRDSSGYNPAFLDYFTNAISAIRAFAAKQKRSTNEVIASGELYPMPEGVVHNRVANDIAWRLYGINKWANDNGVSIVLHIHFNDYPGRRPDSPGRYSGFSVYIPESQYSNAKASRALAEEVFSQIGKYYPASNLPKEDAGVVEDHDLIAIGANNSLDGAAMLIEYSYIYEPAFANSSVRSKVTEDLALQTYLGIHNFFGDKIKLSNYGTSLLPQKWDYSFGRGERESEKVLALQAALMLEGLYPPEGFDKRDCPLSGNFGDCTRLAVARFQKKHGIVSETGYVGGATLEKLNKLFAN